MLRTTSVHATLIRKGAFYLRNNHANIGYGWRSNGRIIANSRASTSVTRSFSTRSNPNQDLVPIRDTKDWIRQFSAAATPGKRLTLLKRLQELKPVHDDGKKPYITAGEVRNTIQKKVLDVLDMSSSEILSTISFLTPLSDGKEWKRMIILIFRKLPKNHINLNSAQITSMLECLHAIGFSLRFEQLYIKHWLLSQTLKVIKLKKDSIPPAQLTSIVKNILAIGILPEQVFLFSWLRMLAKLPPSTPDLHQANMNLLDALRNDQVLFKDIKPDTQQIMLDVLHTLCEYHLKHDSYNIIMILKTLVIMEAKLNDPKYTSISLSVIATLMNNLHIVVKPLNGRDLKVLVNCLEYHEFKWSSLPLLAQQSILTSLTSSALISNSEYFSLTLQSLSRMGLSWQDITITTQQAIIDQLTSLISQNHQHMTNTDQTHNNTTKAVASTLRMMETLVTTWQVKLTDFNHTQQQSFHQLMDSIPSLLITDTQQLLLLSKVAVFMDKIDDDNFRPQWLTAFFNYLQHGIETNKLNENNFFDLLITLSNNLDIERRELTQAWIDLLLLAMKTHFLTLPQPADYDGGRFAIIAYVLSRLQFKWSQLNAEFCDLLLSELSPYSSSSHNNKEINASSPRAHYNRAHRRDPLFFFINLGLLGVHWRSCDPAFRALIVNHVNHMTVKQDIIDTAACTKFSRTIAAFADMHVNWNDAELPREKLQQLFVDVDFQLMDSTSLAKCYWAFPEMGASWSDLSGSFKQVMVTRLQERMSQLDAEQMSNVMHSTAMLTFDHQDITKDQQLMNLLRAICKQVKAVKDDPVCWEQWLSYDEVNVSNMQIFLEFLNTFPAGKKMLITIFDNENVIRRPIHRLLSADNEDIRSRRSSFVRKIDNQFCSSFINQQKRNNNAHSDLIVIKEFRPFKSIYPMNLALFRRFADYRPAQPVAFVLYQSARNRYQQQQLRRQEQQQEEAMATRSWLFKKHLYRYHFPDVPIFCPLVSNLKAEEVEQAVTDLMNEINASLT